MNVAVRSDTDGIGDFGPAMRALNERRRKFVLAQVDNPHWSFTRAATAAGYGTPAGSSQNVLKQIGHRLAHEEEVIAALREETSKRFRVAGAILPLKGMVAIAKDPTHKDHFRALQWLGAQAGFHELSEHKVTVERTDRTGAAMVERIKFLADQLGIDAKVLLGANAVPGLPAVIEGEVVSEVSDAGGL